MKSILRIIFFFVRVLLILLFPFFIFLKSAIWFHDQYSLPTIFNVLAAMGILTFVLFLYLSIGYRFVFKRNGSAESLKQRFIFLSIFVLVASIHLLFFISDSQLKSKELRSEYVRLHPILRLSTGLASKVDKQLVITDISRVSSDYQKMGLPANENSLHYPQKDGYCYAVDIRTKGRPEWLLFSLKMFYKASGFTTLRHSGTADHLHISLRCPSRYRK